MGKGNPLEIQALNRSVGWPVIIYTALKPYHLDELWHDNIIAWFLTILWPVIKHVLITS